MMQNTEKLAEFVKAQWEAKKLFLEAELSFPQVGKFVPSTGQQAPPFLPPPQSNVFPLAPAPINP